ncbi:MAG TPA: molybdenum cofactor biosynthesis protein B [Gammaproteobacteria bacterium]|nr:molybdenum cofactor biosynthesis protein B [Gammaproteobacteria bacterium]
MHATSDSFIALGVALVTVSDTRTTDTDQSGDYLSDAVAEAGHRLAGRRLVPDDIYRIRAVVSAWVADDDVQAVILTGGTGMAPRDRTPEAVRPLFDMEVAGFGELFRMVSFDEIGNSTLQSRAVAGLANETLIACLPGSTGACRTGWARILKDQLDIRHRPCNLAQLVLAEGVSE